MSSPTDQPSASKPDANATAARGAVFPIWLIVAMVLLLYVGALYFDDHGGWFNARVYAPYRSFEELGNWQITSGPDPIAAGKAVYGRTCVACHQPSGMGAPGQYPPLGGSDWVNEKDPGRVIRIVLKGLQGPIKVSGHDFNNVMVAWGAPPPLGLSDEDIAAVITFVRGNKEWGNNASAVTPEQVKAVREKIKSRPGAFTPDELLKISPSE